MNNKQPTWKRPVYLLSAMVLWALLATMVRLFIGLSSDAPSLIDGYFWLALGVGLVLGFCIGRLWYQIVYVDGRRWHHIHLH